MFQRNSEFHDKIVLQYVRKYGGAIFKRAPFDVLMGNGRFIEIKTTKSKRHKWRIQFSHEEIKFTIVYNDKYWIYFVNTEDRYLFPFTIIKEYLDKNKWITSKSFHGKAIERKYILSGWEVKNEKS